MIDLKSPSASAAGNLNIFLSDLGEQVSFQSGDVLWNQDAPARSIFVVSTGILKLQRKWPGGSTTILGLFNRGSIIGEESVMDSPKRYATCVSIVQGKGYLVTQEKLNRVLQQKEVALSLLKLSTTRLQKSLKRMEELLDGPVDSRLASTLLRLGSQIGISDGRGFFIPVRLTRGELAEFIGCRAETTTRLMTKWKRSGLVDTKREGIVIKNIDGLKKIANLA